MRGKEAHWISSYRSSAGEKVNRRREGREKRHSGYTVITGTETDSGVM